MIRARAIASLAGLTLLAGCTMPDPSMAAEVGGKRISEATLTSVVEGCVAATQGRTGIDRGRVLAGLIRGELAADALVQRKVDVTETQLTEIAQRQGAASLRDNPQCQIWVDAVSKIVIAAKTMGEQQFISSAQTVPVKLNPRYGGWVPASLEIAGSGSLSQPSRG